MPPRYSGNGLESREIESRGARVVYLALGESSLAAAAGLGLLLLPTRHHAAWWSAAGITSDLLWGLGATLPLVALALLILGCGWGPFRRLRMFVLDHVAPVFVGASRVQLVCLAAAAGFCEELLFRGVLQQAPSVWIPGTAGVAVGVAASALVFGLAHAMTRSYFVLATGIGVYFSVITLLTGSLVVVMLAHGIYDLIAMVMILRVYRKQRPS